MCWVAGTATLPLCALPVALLCVLVATYRS